MDRCEKCGGAVVNDHGRPLCINCGWSPLTQAEQRQWFTANRAEMVQDLLDHDVDWVLKKWKISPQYISHLKRSPEYREPQPPSSENGNVALPALPAFNDHWHPDVQNKWLDVWLKTRTR